MKYVSQIVELNYATDQDVLADHDLQEWIKSCGNPAEGNVKGLPVMDSKIALIDVLTSFIFRITIHGVSRLIPIANPALSFIPNFPPCLQNDQIPDPSAEMSTQELLRYLPNTGTIGEMMNFYNTFSFSAPYVTLLPLDGIDQDLFFGPSPTHPNNQALIQFRTDMQDFMNTHIRDGLIHQWPRNIET